MRRRLLFLASLALGCRPAPAPVPRRVSEEVAPPRPLGLIAFVEAPEPLALARAFGAAAGVEASPALLIAGSLGVEPSRLAAADLTRAACVALSAEGLVVSFAARPPAELETALAGRWRLREDDAAGAWIESSGDGGSTRSCLLTGIGTRARIACGRSAGAVRRTARWLSWQPVQGGGATLRATVDDDALARTLAPAIGALLGQTADWLEERAASARAARGAPTYGDPEPLVAALRSTSHDVSDLIASLQDLRGEFRVDGPSLVLRIGARLRDDARGGLATLLRSANTTAPLVLDAPAMGYAFAFRAPDDRAADAWARVATQTLDVLGPRLRDRTGAERSIRGLREALGGAVAVAQDLGRPGGVALRVGLRDPAAARAALHAMASASWWRGLDLGGPVTAARTPDGLTLRGPRGGTLSLRVIDDALHAATAPIALTTHSIPDAVAGGVVRGVLADAPAEGALRIRREGTAVRAEVEVRAAARWLAWALRDEDRATQNR